MVSTSPHGLSLCSGLPHNMVASGHSDACMGPQGSKGDYHKRTRCRLHCFCDQALQLPRYGFYCGQKHAQLGGVSTSPCRKSAWTEYVVAIRPSPFPDLTFLQRIFFAPHPMDPGSRLSSLRLSALLSFTSEAPPESKRSK